MAKVVVYHSSYGCDTGCCGHVVAIGENPGEYGLDGPVDREKFDFGHPYSNSPEDKRKFAEELVTELLGAEHVADLDWENCRILDD